MEPDALLRAPIGDLGDRVDGRDAGRADRRDNRAGVCELHRVGAQPERLVGRHLPQLELEQPGGFVDGRVPMLRADDDVPARSGRARDCERESVLVDAVSSMWP